MTPQMIDNMSWEMAEVYGAINDQILINLARHFPYFVADTVPRSAFAYQATKLAEMGQVNAETVRIIRNGLADADPALADLLETAIVSSIRISEPELYEAAKKGILLPPTKPILSPNQTRAFKFYHQQAADKLNLVNTTMLESTQQAYQGMVSDIVSELQLTESMNRLQIGLDTAAGETVTGVSSWNTAVKHATDRMKGAGITGFVDHAGHHWSAEAYAAMDIRTTVANTARSAVWELNSGFGNDLYLVSYHNGARPGCYPWQLKVISATDRSGVTYDLDGNEITIIPQSSTSYGQPAGLFGINCKHYPTPFIPGVSTIDGHVQSKEENDRVYAESQEQRRLERKLREEKRDLMMAKAQGASQEEIQRLQDKCKKSSEDIANFCEETGRARHRDREAVYTKREFPDKESYNPAEFKREQQERFDEYWKNGGEQTEYRPGMTGLTPNVPIIPQTPAQITPTVQNVAPQSTNMAQTVVQSPVGSSVANCKDFTELKTYMKDNYGIDVTTGVKKLDFDLVKQSMTGFESVAKDFPEVAQTIGKVRVGGGGIMSCNGSEITFKSLYFDTKQNPTMLSDAIRDCVKSGWWTQNTTAASIGAHETGHAVEQVLIDISGKYNSQMARVLAWNNCYEARDIVLEACNEVLQTPYGQGKTNVDLIKGISRYGYKGGNSETMAEAFADVYANGQNANPLSIAIRNATLRKYRMYKGMKP